MGFHLLFPLNRSKHAQYGSKLANTFGDGTRVDVVDARNTVQAKEFIHGSNGISMIGLVHGMAHNDPFGPNLAGLGSARVNTVIPNQRIGAGQHLTGE